MTSMQTSMTFGSTAALFGTMLVLASIPSVSVLAVAARSAGLGFAHGVFTAIGIVIGDIVFILLAIFGLAVLVETMGGLFVLVKYLGGAYLVWLGIALWRSKSRTATSGEVVETSLLSSLLTGLFITLGDQKAILFYLVFFPAFLDLSRMSYLDTGIIIAITIVAVGGAKLGYALMADKARLFFDNSRAVNGMNKLAGAVLMGVGMLLVVRG